MRVTTIRFAGAVAAAGILLAGSFATAHAQSASDLVVRIDQLENQVRQLTGQLEQEQFHNREFETALRRMQEDYEYRFQQLGSRGGNRAPAATHAGNAAPPPAAPPPAPPSPSAGNLPPPPVALATAPAAPPGNPGRRSDAFDPATHPDAPGAPKTLGSPLSAAPPPRAEVAPPPRAEVAPPPEDALGGRPAGAPLDLNSMAAAGLPEAPRSTGARPGQYAVATAPPSASPRDSFDLAYGYMQHKDYALAEESFRDFLRRYPSDRLSAEAQFWLGESLFQRQAFRDAADAFLAMSKKYESAAKAPDALLRLGQSLVAINEKELACATFGEVVRKYPRAPASLKQTVDREQKRVHC